MTLFSDHFGLSLFRSLSFGVFALFFLSIWNEVSAASESTMELTSVRIERSIDGEGWILNADVELQLNTRLEDAVNKGLPLYFLFEVEITRPRWYWFDEKSAVKMQVFKLSYHALTRQYRVAIGAYQQSFLNLSDALASMSRIRGWRIAVSDQFSVGERYDAQVRMRLDSSQLPKPFQIIGITNREWNLASDWKRFIFTPAPPL